MTTFAFTLGLFPFFLTSQRTVGKKKQQCVYSRACISDSVCMYKDIRSNFSFMDVDLPFVWIASYPHGKRRLSRGKLRQACFLELEPWFCERLRANGLEIEMKRDNVPLQIVGLVRLTQGIVWSSLALWPVEANLLWRYLGRPLDSFTIAVADAWPCTEPPQAFQKLRSVNQGSRRDAGFGDWVRIGLGNCGVFQNRDTLRGTSLNLPGGDRTTVEAILGLVDECREV
jgi:hypothetical protein